MSICLSQTSRVVCPGEVAKAANLLGMTEQDFFNQYIGVDFYGETDNFVWTLAPITEKATPGKEYPFDPHGKCTFFKDGKCSIHAAKPDECRFYDHDTPDNVASEHRMGIVEQWRNNQEEINRLLGREPEVVTPTHAEGIGMILTHLKHKFGLLGDES